MTAAHVLHYDDMSPGQRLRSTRSIEMQADEIMEFARRFDPHPAHLSPETARATMFGRLCASGWHTGSTTMRLVVETLRVAGGGAGAGVEHLRWVRPVYPGDTLRVELEILAVRPSRSRPEAGLVTYRCTTLNQNNEPVQSFTSTILMPRRAQGAKE